MILNKLSPSEQRLAGLLAAVVFLLINLFLLPRLHSANTEGGKKREELRLQLAAAQTWMKQQDYWQKREQWIREAQPKLTDPGQETATQLERLQRQAKDIGLELRDITLLPLADQPFFKPVGVRFTARGSWPALVRFLAHFQTPVSFNVIPQISIRSAQEPQNVHCEMELQRWFQNP